MTYIFNVWIPLCIIRIARISAEHAVHGRPHPSDTRGGLNTLNTADLQTVSTV
ncbi:hypothetical protein GQ42DRAFT_164128 [Ramicandelaber brevisporus]|nr:hypothetical protein GQ42DRAFT_164128 [Ramicandelaber brevisporus]